MILLFSPYRRASHSYADYAELPDDDYFRQFYFHCCLFIMMPLIFMPLPPPPFHCLLRMPPMPLSPLLRCR